MKILITGARGMLGTDLVGRLKPGHQLLGVGRQAAPNLGIAFQTVDLNRAGKAEEVIQSFRPEVILHSAAMTDVDGCESNRMEALRGNFQLTRNVTDAANRANALVVFFSTDFVFDGKKQSPYEEEDLPCPISVYGESKLLGERYLLLRARHFMILRTSWVFGNAGKNFPRKILAQAETKKPFSVVPDQFGNPTYTADLAEAVEKLIPQITGKAKAGLNQIYHVANEGVVSRYEFARSVLRKKNYSTELMTPISSDQAPPRPAARPRNSALACQKFKVQYGIALRHWEEALEAFLKEDLN